ncbi:MAG: non-heme iron oxygenase ferredoxin subunit [Thermoleophilia bacterium]|nr:non-heme iron oxygenase ferredoxin subunit [Thermoleophilia bacterium]
MAEIEVCLLHEFPPGTHRVLADAGPEGIGVYNCGGALYAIEDRCTHDDGKLCEGDWEPEGCQVICPRHGARFDVRSGQPLTLPAYLPVATYPVRVRDDGMVVVEA